GENLYRLSLTCRHQSGGSLTFGLRQRGQPYRFYWERTEKVPADWRTYDCEFRLGPNDQPMGLWLNLGVAGVFDLREVSLERLSDADLEAEVRRAYPDGGPANLCRSTRFPLGLPNGWSLDRDSSDGDVVRAEAATGSDAPALRLEAPEATILRSEPFPVVYPVAAHAVTARVKGRGDWQVQVVHAGRTFGSATVSLGPDWQRFEVPFTPRFGIPFYQVRWSGSGELLLDRLQAGPRDKCGEYVPPAACEVALCLGSGPHAAAAARIVFEDEAEPWLDVCLVPSPAGAQVRARVTSVQGTVIDLPAVRPDANGRTRLDLGPAMAVTPLGSFRAEVWAERDGSALSPVQELVFHRVRRPRYWGRDAPDSPFGVHTNSTTRHLLMAKAIGLNWTRLHDAGLQYIGWWNLEPERGQWRFFDREIQRYRTHHIKVLAELGTAPPWASYYADTGRKDFGYFDKFFQPKNLDDYVRYVRQVCSRYVGVLDAFDVWNEPWIHAWWGVAYDHEKGGRAGYVTSAEPQRDFARLMQAARSTVREVLPEAVVLGFNTTTGGGTGSQSFSGSDWTRGVLEAGGMEHCDAIAYHAYTGDGVGYPGDSVERGLAVALGPIRESLGTVPRPVWMTEGSPLIHRMGNGLYLHTVPGTPPEDAVEDADRLARYLVSMLANAVRRIFLYSMHAHGDFGTTPKQWNVFTTDEGWLHPSGTAHAHLAWLLEDLRFEQRLDPGGGIHVYLFAGAERAVAAVSSGPDWQPFALPAVPGATWTDLFGNPVSEGTAFAGRVVYAEGSGPGALERLRDPFAPGNP
ncbi:MAG: hypothetical protein JXR77_15305, partial [Lentisphaeria bacterium]|nr:hypothetical protein [Lentisphaeria bacterium]